MQRLYCKLKDNVEALTAIEAALYRLSLPKEQEHVVIDLLALVCEVAVERKKANDSLCRELESIEKDTRELQEEIQRLKVKQISKEVLKEIADAIDSIATNICLASIP